MPSKKKRIRGIILRQAKLKESDLIVTLLLDDGTRCDALARGARKPGGKLAGRTELFDETDFMLTQDRSLGILSEAELVDDHHRLRADLESTAAASCVIELARFTSYEDAPDGYLYPICSRALKALEEALAADAEQHRARLDVVVAAYAFKLLAHGGWKPTLDSCVLCGDFAPTRFSVAQGGMLCESCSREVEGAEPLDKREQALLHALIYSTFDELLARELQPSDAALMLSLAHSWAQTHLDARLKSFEFYVSR